MSVRSFPYALRLQHGLVGPRRPRRKPEKKIIRLTDEQRDALPIEKVYFKIGELARMFLVRPSAIRFWESYFGLHAKARVGGKRRFTQVEVKQFTEVHRLLKVEGYTLEGAKRKLQEVVAKAT